MMTTTKSQHIRNIKDIIEFGHTSLHDYLYSNQILTYLPPMMYKPKLAWDNQDWTPLLLMAAEMNNSKILVQLFILGVTLDDIEKTEVHPAALDFLKNIYHSHYVQNQLLKDAINDGDLEACKNCFMNGADIHLKKDDFAVEITHTSETYSTEMLRLNGHANQAIAHFLVEQGIDLAREIKIQEDILEKLEVPEESSEHGFRDMLQWQENYITFLKDILKQKAKTRAFKDGLEFLTAKQDNADQPCHPAKLPNELRGLILSHIYRSHLSDLQKGMDNGECTEDKPAIKHSI